MLRSGKNIRLFKNDVIEQCTYVHPSMPLLVWGPIIVWLFSHGVLAHEFNVRPTLALALCGLLTWTLAEYLLHRYVFHFKPHGAIQERLAYLIHGVHHDDPGDERRLLMPPMAGVVIAFPFFALFHGLFGPIAMKPFFSGFLFGYLCYDYTHFAVHFWSFKSKRFKELKRNHMRHHFGQSNERFGVSSGFWDVVFGTGGSGAPHGNR